MRCGLGRARYLILKAKLGEPQRKSNGAGHLGVQSHFGRTNPNPTANSVAGARPLRASDSRGNTARILASIGRQGHGDRGFPLPLRYQAT